jgi:hypothetical protein
MATAGVDSTLRMVFGLVHGLVLAMAVPLFYLYAPNTVKQMPFFLFLVLLPIISYFWGFGLNALSQYIRCQTVAPGQVALVSVLGPIFVILFSALAWALPFIRSPVESVIPVSADADMKYSLGFAFYLLWAGIYSQNIGSGMVQSCPK